MIKLFNEEIKPTIFPDGTSQIWKLPKHVIELIGELSYITVRWEFENEAELFHVIQLAELITNINVDSTLILCCPYLPYGRQDKEVDNESTFALTVFCCLITGYYDKLITVDAHNPKAKAFSNLLCFENINPIDEIRHAVDKSRSDLICAPDIGASTRYDIKFHLVMKKVRDQSTGEIVGLDLDLDKSIDPGEIVGKSVILVDDICDGGRTFIEASKVLYQHGASAVNLYVSHGIFSKGLKPLYDSGIVKIYTKDGYVSGI